MNEPATGVLVARAECPLRWVVSLTAFGMVAMRQAKGCLNLFIAQSVLLAASAPLLAIGLPRNISMAWRL